MSVSGDGGPNLERAEHGRRSRTPATSSTTRSGSRPVRTARSSSPGRGSTSGRTGAGYLESPIVGAISYDRGKTWNRQSFPVSDKAHPYQPGLAGAFAPERRLSTSPTRQATPSTGYATDSLVLARSTRRRSHVRDRRRSLGCTTTWTATRCSTGRQTLTDMHFRLNSYPSMSIDPQSGRIAFAWADVRRARARAATAARHVHRHHRRAQAKLVHGFWGVLRQSAVRRR